MVSHRELILPSLLWIGILGLQAASLQHSATLKSFNGIINECSSYLSPGGGSCSDRCLGLVGRFWNDTVARPSVSVGRFYRPDPCDQDYINRTLDCICDTVLPVPRNDICQRASNGLQCYRYQYGRLVASDPLYVGITPLQSQQVFQECSQMLSLSPVQLQQIAQSGYSNSPEGSCLVRCYLIRAGLYTDSHGPDIARFAVQCEGYDDAYEASVGKCYQELKLKQLDNCTLAARMYDECIQSNKLSNSNIDIVSLLVGLVTGFIPVGK
uniref:Atypical odorant-binding protein 68 n=1 Tax=Aedes albopictus TaxID=7160 RepID=B5TYS5_AEDAL|nr:atypical odorant-binding protein 68 [Aedes albopictus]